jgi:hypothetical protein
VSQFIPPVLASPSIPLGDAVVIPDLVFAKKRPIEIKYVEN